MFFLRGKEGSARLGRFSFPARICGRADPKRCVENIKRNINREDRSKARMRVPAKRIVVWTATKVIIIVIKSEERSEISFGKKKMAKVICVGKKCGE